MDYYEIDSRKYTFAEYWRLSPVTVPFLERLRIGMSDDRPPRVRWARGSTLRSLAVWIAIWSFVILLWSFFVTSRKPMSPDSRSIHDLVSATPRLTLTCSDLPEASIRPGSPSRHGFTVAGVFADADAASRAAADLRPAEDGDVVRLGPVVFFRHAEAEGAERTSWRPIEERLAGFGARTLIEAPADEKSVSAGLLWRLDDPGIGDELETSLSAFFGAPYYFALRAPWAPPDLTPAERRARRHYMTLSRSDATPGYGYVRRFLRVLWRRDGDSMNELMEEEKRKHAERKSKAVEKLRKKHPELDPELARRYLDFVDAPPFLVAGDPDDPAHQERVAERMGELYRRGAALGELMGQLAYRWREEPGRPPEVVGPAKAYTVWAPEVDREDGRFRLDGLLFDDVAVGLPALLGALCGAGARDLVLTLDDYDDVRGD